jgi:hypothetical protein
MGSVFSILTHFELIASLKNLYKDIRTFENLHLNEF